MSAPGCARGDELDAALDGRLGDDDVRDILAHAARCAGCEARRRERAQRREALDALPDAAPDELASRRLRARLVSSALRREAPRRTPWRAALAAAGAVVAVALGATVVRTPTTDALAAGETRLGEAGALRPAAGARWSVRDEGGDTRVRLEEGAITLRVRRRRPGERFRVLLRDAEVEVRGTRFEVVARGGLLRAVRVDEGLVAVRRRGDAEQLLAAGSRYAAPEAPLPAPAPRPPPVVVAPPPPAPQALPPDALPPAPRRPAASRHSVDPARDFRAGALAHARGDHGTAAESLARFLDAAPAEDPRREDARYLRVLALRGARREGEALSEARRYLREFPSGLRRAEVASWAARALAARGDCAGASQAAEQLPAGATAAMREGVRASVARCPR
ncbi:MAG: FecR domain-containing protein [Polyangiales bacterium]